jgi:hypothetical protein
MPTLSGKIPRITIRGGTGLCVTEEGWRFIEGRYGHQIPGEARSSLNAAINEFLQLASAEDDAPSKADALTRLESLKGQAASLAKAINKFPVDHPIRRYVDEEIAFAYSIAKYEDSTPILEYLSTFERELARFSKACQDTITFLSNHDFWPTGGAWDVWIRQLTTILHGYRLPTSARKDSDKSDKPSQFVELVDALQRLLPERFRRSIHSKPALGTAIHKARDYASRPLVSKRQGRPVGINSRTRR